MIADFFKPLKIFFTPKNCFVTSILNLRLIIDTVKRRNLSINHFKRYND